MMLRVDTRQTQIVHAYARTFHTLGLKPMITANTCTHSYNDMKFVDYRNHKSKGRMV